MRLNKTKKILEKIDENGSPGLAETPLNEVDEVEEGESLI
jgi:hypothetical protein